MGFRGWLVLLVALLLGADTASQKKTSQESTGYNSPRLARLAKALAAGESGALEAFWKEVQAKAPLIEPVPGDESRRWVTFLFRGAANSRRVALMGGMPTAAEFNLLSRLPGTDLWYLTQAFPRDARFAYFFVVDPPEAWPSTKLDFALMMLRIRFDPLNPHTFSGRPTVQLPDASPQPLLKHLPGVAQGKLRVRNVRSPILKADRSVTIYTPPGYDAKGQPCGLLVLFDGHAYKTDIPAPVILDNLLAQGKIPPFVAVLVHQVDRLNELMCSESFADFLAQELVPWVRKEYCVSHDPSRTIVGGLSAGGLMAAYCGLRHPEVFGNVLSQSGSFWYTPEAMKMTERPLPFVETGWLTRKFVEAPRSPVRFYLEVGRLEMSFTANQVAENRRLRDVLQAKGYDVTYSEFTGGHDGFCWRGTFARGLLALVTSPAPGQHVREVGVKP